ncbi:Ig-like domain-containing protein, partial [Vibrio splendidus]
MNRQQNPIRATLLFTLLAALSGCGENEDGGERPKQGATPPSPPHLTARDGFAQLAPGAQGGVNLAPYVTANQKLNVEVSEVYSLNRDQACGEAGGVNNGTQVGFTTQLDGSAMCRYQYTVEGQAASGETVSASAEVTVVGSTATNALLPPIPAAMVLASNASSSTLEIDLSAELSKLGDRFPTGYTLSSDVSILGDGRATANQPAAGIIRYQAASIGPQRLIYTLEDSSGNAEHKFGAIDIAVSDEINQPPQAESKTIYPHPVTVGQTVDIDVSDYISSPDGDDFSITYVNSFTASVAPKSPQVKTNKVFTFNASVSGQHYVSYAVADHNGGFATGIMQVNTLDAREQAPWADIPFDSNIYQAPLTQAEAATQKAGASGRYYDNAYTPALSVATFNIAEASAYCGSKGRLPTTLELTSLYSAQPPGPNNNWPTGRPYWAKDADTASLINLANGANEPVTADPKEYVTCIANGSLVASAINGYAIADNIDMASVEATVTLGGVPKAGEVVNATISSGTASLSQASGVTNSQGKVRFNVNSDVAGTATIEMSFGGESARQNVEFRGDDRTAHISAVVTTLDEAYANPYSRVTNAVEVSLVDINNNPVSGQLVSFSTSGRSKLVDATSELITNHDGIVTANVTDDIGEAVTIVASYTNGSGDSSSISETLTFVSPEVLVSTKGNSYSPALNVAESIKASK